MVGRIIGIVGFAALLCALAIAVAGPGTRLGFWDYSFGLQLIRDVSTPKEIAGGVSLSPLFTAAGLSLIGGIVAMATRRPRAGFFAIVAALLAGGAAAVPLKMKAAFEGNPFIHEVTTDFDNPPAIIAAADLPRKNPAEYRGADAVPQTTDGITVAEAQEDAFPDIQPIVIDANLEAARDTARAVIADMKMEVLAEGPDGAESGAGWRIEAVATSSWFGFKDDFIVRLTPAEAGRTRVDLRSKSRIGGSDLGANAARVRDFRKRFSAKAAA